ncbi:hypothetical protein Trco_006004 [Trichoderma cornu-damae]|uniref:DUF4045 domain-containing protein n=1 Tax=Trichoderma cornu-damae TaxID=654480 RepID=A0A9P8QI81_9HYPO|nr:hypothetical protein Trco_006004 [Trichoderma cornu-damae]
MSDEVSQFLEQVERLRGQQIEDDEMRAREREEFLAAKRERQARREERARSISPQKSSPANTPSPRTNRRTVNLSESLRLDSPAGESLDKLRERLAGPETPLEADAQLDAMPYSASPTKEFEASEDPDAKRGDAASASRASPLSWQRRPTRSNSRPLSVVAAQNAAQGATHKSFAEAQEQPLEPPSPTQPLSKDHQIGKSLGSKDASWLRQTAERGLDSAPPRRSQVVEDQDRLDMSSLGTQLPPMTGEDSAERPVSRSGEGAFGKLVSHFGLNPPSFDNPADEKPLAEPIAPAAAGRTSPVRTASPTKGMGGFVQSAMMKRSDSVKRWSVASPPGLTRPDNMSSHRGSIDRGPPSRPQSMFVRDPTAAMTPAVSRPASRPSSRPTSRHGEKEKDSKSSESSPRERRPKTPSSTSPPHPQKHELPLDDASLPISPSKTMEPRRWSPTKSSWLESALNKPDSPKPPPKPLSSQQPAWMVELNKNKAERASNPNAEPSRPAASHRHQVSIDGLMRSTPMGSRLNLNTTGLGGIYSPPGAQATTPRASVQGFPAATASSTASSTAGPERPRSKSRGALDQVRERRSESLSSIANPLAAKAKPDAPPKKDLDFRSNLKPRAAEAPVPKAQEPEFKAVFGTLRRTKTQNFKAPDELKDNILRGKAALNTTDGPQRSTIRDDFKDAIQKKRDDFKKAQAEGKGTAGNAMAGIEKPKPLVPEALAVRAELGKPTAALQRDAPLETTTPSGQSKKPDSPKPTPPKRKSSQVNLARQSSPSLTPTKSTLAEKPRLENAEPDTPTRTETSPRSLPGLLKKKSAPSKLGGLAGRFNPALAGMIARGPPPASSNGGSRAEEAGQAGGDAQPSQPGPQLTHMTKNRARGPRRKAPSGVSNLAAGDADPQAGPSPSPASRQANVFGERKPAPPSVQDRAATKPNVPSKPKPTEPRKMEVDSRPVEHVAPLNLRRRLTQPDIPVSEIPSQPEPSQEPEPGSPKKLNMKRMSKFFEQGNNAATAEPPKQPGKLSPQKTGTWSPVKTASPLPEPEPAREPAKPTQPMTGSWPPAQKAERSLPDPRSPVMNLLGESKPPAADAAPEPVSAAAKAPLPGPKPSYNGLPREVETRPASPPPAAASPRPLPRPPAEPAASQSPTRPQTGHGSDVSAILHDFFGPPYERIMCDMDPADILANYPKFGAKIKTLSFHMFQIDGEGKQTIVPAHREQMLFEREMYIAGHNFTNEAGWKVREVYFWIGDEVADADEDVAEAVAQQEARQLGGKLIKLRQGKETSEFLQALGGVVIVRRGASTRYDSLAPSMLCGRRYQGQVAFDEVDFTTASLCAGFAYLITHSGNCYLWKGKGSDVDELGCARLVGMDLTVTGRLIEYDEGDEPASFWAMLGGESKPHSADHWRLKPGYGKYNSRLFCSDVESRQQIYEISPFNQADMSTFNIYILDAFFEMYIIVGSQAQSQYASFRNALDFAQEYAVLAASMEDRPFIPISTVVLEGVPRDLKRVFRKWTDERCPTLLHVPSAEAGLKRGRSLRVVPLTQAILALKE